MSAIGVESIGAYMLQRAQNLMLGRAPGPLGAPVTASKESRAEAGQMIDKAKAELKNGKWAPILGSKL